MGDPETHPHLRAIPSTPGDGIEAQPVTQPAVYKDVTAPGERKPVLPHWLRTRQQFRDTSRRVAGYQWYLARFHGLRLGWYAAVTAFWAVVGVFALAWFWLMWWLMPVPPEAHLAARQEGWRSWKSLHNVHKETTKQRAVISAAVGGAAVLGGYVLWLHVRWALFLLAGALLLAAARFGRPEGHRIITPARVPSQYEKLTPDVVVRALGSIGISGIDKWLREGRELVFPAPVRQDGPGWRAEVDLPWGVTAEMVIERRDRFASGLRRPLGAVWPEPISDAHPGRLEVWVGQQDVAKIRPSVWPLAKTGQADIFGAIPFGTDPRRRPITAPMFEVNWLIGAAPGQGKTNTVRVLACGAALDPIADLWVHEHAGKGDLEPLAKVCHRYVSGLDDESIAYTAESLALLRTELGRRSAQFKKLPASARPEGKLTRELASQRALRLRPLVCVVDECQNVFMHPDFGKQAAADAAYVIRLGRAYGLIVILATQRPDKESLPTAIRGIVTARFCLQVPDQDGNDMILGTGAYKRGCNAVTLRPKTDAGIGWLKADEVPQVVKTYKLDLEPTLERVAARARLIRERAGVLSGYALGEDDRESRDVLADVLAVFGDDPGLHWPVLAERLTQRFPDRWDGITADAVSAQLRDLQVPSVTVSVGGAKARGCRKDAIEQAAR
jgi:S-DNA-T family DNA segregation ATPase FtsK/SpoIIIE